VKRKSRTQIALPQV